MILLLLVIWLPIPLHPIICTYVFPRILSQALLRNRVICLVFFGRSQVSPILLFLWWAPAVCVLVTARGTSMGFRLVCRDSGVPLSAASSAPFCPSSSGVTSFVPLSPLFFLRASLSLPLFLLLAFLFLLCSSLALLLLCLCLLMFLLWLLLSLLSLRSLFLSPPCCTPSLPCCRLSFPPRHLPPPPVSFPLSPPVLYLLFPSVPPRPSPPGLFRLSSPVLRFRLPPFLLLFLLLCLLSLLLFPLPFLVLLLSSLSYVNPVTGSSLPPSGFPRDSRSSPGVSAGVGLSSVLHLTGPHISFGDCPSTSGISCSFREDSPPFTAVEADVDEGDKELPYLGKGELSKSFQEMISLITSSFPKSKPSVSSDSDSLIPWLDVFGTTRRCALCVFLKPFLKLAAISKEVD